MTIRLPKELDSFIRGEVLSGHFASEDDAIAEAVRLLRQRVQSQPTQIGATEARETDPAHEPIWEKILEISASIPDEVWDQIPADSSEQLDHYLYGTSKRPTTR
jgi:Arc/MetJ-type ribon-helix-helix transcriptional regulator